ncbi:MAG: adenosylcobinamide-GDP ribazoletransferase [Pseudomonadota bacterium]
MDFRKPLVDVLSVAAFFSRLPFWSLRERIDQAAPAEPLGRLAWAFPLAGLLAALPAVLVLAILGQTSLPAPTLATLFVATMMASTGALHEDGLADLCDGLGGGRTRERKLEIMRDSTIGTYGALGLIVGVLLRIMALASLIAASSAVLVGIGYAGIAGISRAAMLRQWRTSQPARADGLARSQGTPSASGVATAFAVAVMIAIFLVAPVFGILPTALSLVISAAGVLALCRACDKQLGGYTGDTLGAGQQIVETSCLVCISAALGGLS